MGVMGDATLPREAYSTPALYRFAQVKVNLSYILHKVVNYYNFYYYQQLAGTHTHS